MEELNIINDDDVVIGKASKYKCHANALLHRSVFVFIFNKNNQLLLQKRSSNKSIRPNKVTASASGHVHAGESYLEAARRELKEELGLEIEIHEKLKTIGPYENDKELIKLFVGYMDNEELIVNESEISDIFFLTITEINEAIEKQKFDFGLSFIKIFQEYIKLADQHQTNNDCVFCRISAKKTENFYDKVLYETENLIVIPALGAIVEGYLIIATKEHYKSFSKVNSKIINELKTLIQKLSRILSKYYIKPIFFEHGEVNEKVGTSIVHAHIHALPCTLDVHFFEPLLQNANKIVIDDLIELQKQEEKNKSYLFFMNQKEKMFVYEVFNLPSQFLRRIVATKVLKSELWDWRKHKLLELTRKTIDKIRSEFE
ncbi:MAG: NUDIX domain-containing protein [Candidatus Heimdallarchaeota archaeon]|nr:NUDIX domain-containing protein [Candidatus Heimdallarchaeota archaeon]